MFDFSHRTSAAPSRHNPAMVGLVTLMLALSSPTHALAGTIDAVSVGERAITIRFDDLVVGATTQLLAGPDRIAIDIAGAQTGPAIAAAGFARAIRQGQQRPDLARIVLDLGEPAVVTGGKFGADGRSLTLSWRAASADEFTAASRAGKLELQPPAQFRAKPPQPRYSVSVPIGKAKPAIALPTIAGPDDPRLPLVVLDAGHGGHDPGAISPHSGKHEKDVTLAIARAIRDELVATGRVRVALTRGDDRFLVLEERYGIARTPTPPPIRKPAAHRFTRCPKSPPTAKPHGSPRARISRT
jgi:N-acetylmuramoyl-L-alanine amidase